jgi:hypothetical protein
LIFYYCYEQTQQGPLPDKSKLAVRRGRKTTDQAKILIAGLPKEGERSSDPLRKEVPYFLKDASMPRGFFYAHSLPLF